MFLQTRWCGARDTGLVILGATGCGRGSIESYNRGLIIRQVDLDSRKPKENRPANIVSLVGMVLLDVHYSHLHILYMYVYGGLEYPLLILTCYYQHMANMRVTVVNVCQYMIKEESIYIYFLGEALDVYLYLYMISRYEER